MFVYQILCQPENTHINHIAQTNKSKTFNCILLEMDMKSYTTDIKASCDFVFNLICMLAFLTSRRPLLSQMGTFYPNFFK